MAKIIHTLADAIQFQGIVSMGGGVLNDVGVPVLPADAVPKSYVDTLVDGKKAATIIVDGSGAADATTIQGGVDLLPAEGGEVYIREGTYAITSTVVLPDKDIKFVGTGQSSTIISIGANAIAAFTTSFARKYSFMTLSVKAGNVAGQIGFLNSVSGASFDLRDVVIGGADIANRIEVAFDVLGGPTIDLQGVQINLREVVAARVAGGVGAPYIRARNVVQRGYGGFSSVQLDAVQCTFNLENVFAATFFYAVDCDFLSASGLTMTFTSQGVKVASCLFGGVTLSLAAGSTPENALVGNFFTPPIFGAMLRYIDVLVASGKVAIVGNRFNPLGVSSETIRIANTGNVVTGNTDCEVTEIGFADLNRYTGNTGFAGSTIIGPDSVVEGWRRKDATGVATVDGLTLVFSHHNEKALEGSGSIKNTGAASLTVRREVTDAYGTTATQDDIVLAGASLNWRVGEAIGTALPPHETFSVYVRSTAAGVPTTYSLRHASVGAE